MKNKIISFFRKEVKIEKDLQSEFDQILKNIINPFFNENGFKKNGNTFNKKINDLVQVASIQKSKWNSQTNISFTINVGFLITEIYLEDLNHIPKFIREYDCHINFRLGNFIYGNDYWYEINTNTKREKLEIQIYNDLHDSLKTIFLSIINMENLKEFILSNQIIRTTTINKIKIFLKTNEFEKAKELLKIEYINTLNPQDYISKVIHPNGTEIINTSKSEINFGYAEILKNIAHKNNIKIE